MKVLAATPENIRFAGEALRRGELVGLPTETVYGIAAVATNRAAVLATFELKRRPAENPLIVHVNSLEQIYELVESLPAEAAVLARAFWPGPLTIVMQKSSSVPNEVTAGLSTVAVRYPSHPVAQSIIGAADAPLSAPSANRFMGLSPTRAEHVDPSILAGLACLVDGGPCAVGVESTVVDCAGDGVAVLRPGGISAEQIQSVIGTLRDRQSEERRSPGQYRRHYSPRTPVRLVPRLDCDDDGIAIGESLGSNQISLPEDPAGYAAALYAALHDLDELGLDLISVQAPPKTPEWSAVWDRLDKMLG